MATARSKLSVNLLGAIEAEASSKRGSKCSVTALLQKLNPTDRTVVEEALNNPAYEGTAISRALKKLGHDVQAGSIQRHRRNACTCAR